VKIPANRVAVSSRSHAVVRMPRPRSGHLSLRSVLQSNRWPLRGPALWTRAVLSRGHRYAVRPEL